MNIEAIARVCHEANRTFCDSIGDSSQLPWESCHGWQRESALKGVQWRLDNPNAPESAQHDAWMADKIADGWTFGPVKDASVKEHPCIVPFEELPPEQRAKDALFVGIVEAFRGLAIVGV